VHAGGQQAGKQFGRKGHGSPAEQWVDHELVMYPCSKKILTMSWTELGIMSPAS